MKPHNKIEKRKNGSLRVAKIFDPNLPSKTQQQFADTVNVNKIMARFRKTGQFDHLRNNPGAFVDFEEIGSYEDALNKVIHANNVFNHLPSNIRTKFDNNPQKMLNFLADPKNEKEAIELGLRNKPIPQEPPTPTPPTQPIPKPE